MKSNQRTLIVILDLVLIGVFLYLLLRNQTAQTSLSSLVTSFRIWPNVPVIIIVLLVVIFSRVSVTFRKLIGEVGQRNLRSRRSGVLYFVFAPLFGLFSLYYLFTLTPESLSSNQQLSIIVISIALAALPLGVASIKDIHPNKRVQLIGITQKFVLVMALFTIFTVMIYMFNLAPFKELDIDHPNWQTLNGWIIAVSFLIEAFCYFGSIALFIFGTFDLITAFANLGISDELQPTRPIQPERQAPVTRHLEIQKRATHKARWNFTAKKVIWIIAVIGLALSAMFGYFACLWPNSKDLWIPLSIESGSLAISLLLINLLVEKYVRNEKRNRWEKVRSIIIGNIQSRTANILLHFNFKFNQKVSVAEWNNENIIEMARQIANDGLKYDWSSDNNEQLKYFVATLEFNINALDSTLSHYSFVLEEEPNLFEKIFAVQSKMGKLLTTTSMRSYRSKDEEILRQQQNDNINQSFTQLLLASIDLFDETNRFL